MAKKLVDGGQTEIYPDKSIKHRAQARSLREVSLGIDFWSAISFRAYERRFKPPVRDTVFVDVYVETDSGKGMVDRKQVIKDNTGVDDGETYDIVWDPDMNTDEMTGSFAKFPVDSSFTQDPCNIEVVWKWSQNKAGIHKRKWSMFYSVREYMPTYASLSDDERDLCVSILNRFWGLFDNHYGNGMPNLAEEVQTHFGYETIANDMAIAVSKINSKAIQQTHYGIGDSGLEHFPKDWYNLLMTDTLIEVIREFIYGYIEQPNVVGQVGVAYADRRDYVNRWNDAKKDLEADAATLMQAYSRYHLNFGGSSILVGGGFFGGGGKGSGLVKNSWSTAVQKGWHINMFQPVSVAQFDPNS